MWKEKSGRNGPPGKIDQLKDINGTLGNMRRLVFRGILLKNCFMILDGNIFYRDVVQEMSGKGSSGVYMIMG